MNIPQFNTLRDLFVYSTDNFKSNTVFSYIGGLSYTYEQFGQKTNEVASLLGGYGIEYGDRVAILSQNMPNWPVAYFATVAFGKVIVPMLPDFSEMEVRNVIEHSESKALFVSQRLLYKVPQDL